MERVRAHCVSQAAQGRGAAPGRYFTQNLRVRPHLVMLPRGNRCNLRPICSLACAGARLVPHIRFQRPGAAPSRSHGAAQHRAYRPVRGVVDPAPCRSAACTSCVCRPCPVARELQSLLDPLTVCRACSPRALRLPLRPGRAGWTVQCCR